MSELETGAVESAPVENVAPAPSTPEAPLWEPGTTEARMAEVFDRLNPQERVNRTETGKFESKEPIADQTTDPTTEGQTPTETAPPEPASPAIEAPQSLPAALRDKWSSVPPEVAEWAAKREAESHKRITELGETAKAAEQIRNVVERYRPSLRGLQAEQAIDKLFAANDFLDKDPVQGIQWLAQAYGVDLSRFAQHGEQGDQPAESAHVQALNAKIDRLERALADTSNRVMSREQQEQNARLQTLAKLEDDFAKGKEDHWSDIYDDVADQVKIVITREPDLSPEKAIQKAYERALKLRDDISGKLNEAKAKAEAEKAEAEKKRKADEAKKHASLNVRSSNAATPKKGNWEDTMRDVANRLMG